MEQYEELAGKIVAAKNAGDYRLAGDLLLSGCEVLSRETGQKYNDVKDMVIFCMGAA